MLLSLSSEKNYVIFEFKITDLQAYKGKMYSEFLQTKELVIKFVPNICLLFQQKYAEF